MDDRCACDIVFERGNDADCTKDMLKVFGPNVSTVSGNNQVKLPSGS